MPLQLFLQLIKNIYGNIFRGGLSFRKAWEIIEKGVIQGSQYLVHFLFQDLKIYEDTFLVQPSPGDRNLHLPVVTVEFFTSTVKVAQPVGSGKMR